MQQLRVATASRLSPEDGAQDLLAAVPLIMQFLRSEMRRHRQVGLTVPQFRALVFVSHNDDASLSAMAEHLGLSLPATSRMVDLLVRRGLMERQVRADDRRSVSLSLTGRGKGAFRSALQAAQRALARRFGALSAQELTLVSGAMRVLGRVLAPERQAAKS